MATTPTAWVSPMPWRPIDRVYASLMERPVGLAVVPSPRVPPATPPARIWCSPSSTWASAPASASTGCSMPPRTRPPLPPIRPAANCARCRAGGRCRALAPPVVACRPDIGVAQTGQDRAASSTRATGCRSPGPIRVTGCKLFRPAGAIALGRRQDRLGIEPGDIEPVHDAVRLPIEAWIPRQYQRIVAGYHALGRSGQLCLTRIAFERVFDVDHDRENFAQLEVLVVMRAVGGKHDGPGGGHDAHALQAAAVPADLMHGDPWGHLGVAVVELHAAGIDVAHHLADVIGGEGIAQVRVAHAGPGSIGHLRCLQMEPGGREGAERTGMIVVHVRDDQLFDAIGR